jgi:hypothetical protein
MDDIPGIGVLEKVFRDEDRKGLVGKVAKDLGPVLGGFYFEIPLLQQGFKTDQQIGVFIDEQDAISDHISLHLNRLHPFTPPLRFWCYDEIKVLQFCCQRQCCSRPTDVGVLRSKKPVLQFCSQRQCCVVATKKQVLQFCGAAVLLSKKVLYRLSKLSGIS